MNTNPTIDEIRQHINFRAPEDCFELTVFEEAETWEMARDGIVTYDEADHMADVMSLYDARAILAWYNCTCEQCGAI